MITSTQQRPLPTAVVGPSQIERGPRAEGRRAAGSRRPTLRREHQGRGTNRSGSHCGRMLIICSLRRSKASSK